MNPTKTKGKPNREKKEGTPAEAAVHIQKKAKAKKINPNGIEIKPGSMNAFLTGLPIQITFSLAFNSLFNLDKKIHPHF
jgi:hypothetical protein